MENFVINKKLKNIIGMIGFLFVGHLQASDSQINQTQGFVHIDLNNDGLITLHEFKNRNNRRSRRRDRKSVNIFLKRDLNNNGFIDISEFRATDDRGNRIVVRPVVVVKPFIINKRRTYRRRRFYHRR